jgi:surface protein
VTSHYNLGAFRTRALILLAIPVATASSCVRHPQDETNADLGGAGGAIEAGGTTGGENSGGTNLGGASTGGTPSAGGCSPDSIPADAFVTVWDTEPYGSDYTSGPTIVELPWVATGAYDYTVDWCDGTSGHNEAWHSYAEPGTYVVVMRGLIEGWHFPTECVFSQDGHCYYDRTDASKLLEIRQWGTFRFGTTPAAFEGCDSLRVTATDVPDLSIPTSLSRAFAGCIDIVEIPSIAAWDTSNVTDMSALFNATNFDGDLSAWDTSNVTDMSWMFSGSGFTGDISTWDTSGVTDMSGMFSSTGFDGDISSWDTSRVTDMSGMFERARFNGDISAWDTSSVTSMARMFSYAYVSGATSPFSGDISAWDTSSVRDMSQMFHDAIAFNRDLGAWDITSLSDATDMLTESGLSTENYDALLTGWASQETQIDVVFGADGLQYSTVADSARAALTDDRNWTITDGGLALGAGGAGGASP